MEIHGAALSSSHLPTFRPEIRGLEDLCAAFGEYPEITSIIVTFHAGEPTFLAMLDTLLARVKDIISTASLRSQSPVALTVFGSPMPPDGLTDAERARVSSYIMLIWDVLEAWVPELQEVFVLDTVISYLTSAVTHPFTYHSASAKLDFLRLSLSMTLTLLNILDAHPTALSHLRTQRPFTPTSNALLFIWASLAHCPITRKLRYARDSLENLGVYRVSELPAVGAQGGREVWWDLPWECGRDIWVRSGKVHMSTLIFRPSGMPAGLIIEGKELEEEWEEEANGRKKAHGEAWMT